jgi:hypothetical protein
VAEDHPVFFDAIPLQFDEIEVSEEYISKWAIFKE